MIHEDREATISDIDEAEYISMSTTPSTKGDTMEICPEDDPKEDPPHEPPASSSAHVMGHTLPPRVRRPFSKRVEPNKRVELNKRVDLYSSPSLSPPLRNRSLQSTQSGKRRKIER